MSQELVPTHGRREILDVHAGAAYGEGGVNIVDDDSMDSRMNGPLVKLADDRVGPTEDRPVQNFYMNRPQFMWVQTGTVDHDARHATVQLAEQAFRFGQLMEERMLHLLNRVQGTENT